MSEPPKAERPGTQPDPPLFAPDEEALRRAWIDLLRHVRERTAELGSPGAALEAEIVQRSMAEQATAQVAAIVQSSEDAIVGATLGGTVLSWNRGAEGLYGYAADEMIGRSYFIVVPQERHGKVAALFEQINRGERVEHYETVRLTKSGQPVALSITMSPIRNSAGEIIGASMIGRDITERRALEAQLVQAQKFELIGQLAAGIAHEINTPIQYIGSNVQFLQHAFQRLVRLLADVQGRLVPAGAGILQPQAIEELGGLLRQADLSYFLQEADRALQQSREGVEHVAKIVRSVNELAHPGQRKKVPLDVNRAIESTINVARNEWKYVARMVTDFDRSLPKVPCLVDEFNQAMLNILVNAAQAIAEALQERRGERGTITISTRRDGVWAEVRVKDTGPGIPAAVRSRIFEPFFTTKEVGRGTGQGLAIAHAAIVQKHGGTLSFESQEGAGTTFIIRLPLQGTDEPEESHESTHRAAG